VSDSVISKNAILLDGRLGVRRGEEGEEKASSGVQPDDFATPRGAAARKNKGNPFIRDTPSTERGSGPRGSTETPKIASPSKSMLREAWHGGSRIIDHDVLLETP